MTKSKQNNWWEKPIPDTKDMDKLTQVYNQKYGAYDYSKDARLVDVNFGEKFLSILKKIKNVNTIIVTGANSGHEIPFLTKVFPTANIYATDISSKALCVLKTSFPDVHIYHGDMEHLPFTDKYFDLYISCRAIHSSNVNLQNAVKEAARISKHILVTVANGYLIKGKVCPGQYNYEKKTIDTTLPWSILDKIKTHLKDEGYKTRIVTTLSEIFIVSHT